MSILNKHSRDEDEPNPFFKGALFERVLLFQGKFPGTSVGSVYKNSCITASTL